MKQIVLKLDPQQFAVVWAALGECKASIAFTVMKAVELQVQEQERLAPGVAEGP